jgi:hypothetical protein
MNNTCHCEARRRSVPKRLAVSRLKYFAGQDGIRCLRNG